MIFNPFVRYKIKLIPNGLKLAPEGLVESEL